MRAHQNSSAVPRKLRCCDACTKSLRKVASNKTGACHPQSATAWNIQATRGAVRIFHAASTGFHLLKDPHDSRHVCGNAHKKVTNGLPRTSKGAEMTIMISCCVMWTQKSCSPSS